jgi:hypothetical protein
MSDDPTQSRLEQEFRDGLRRAADRAEVGVPLVPAAYAGARTRRRRRWAVAGTVAAVVAVSGMAVAVQGGDRRGGSADHTATQPTFAPVTDWRPESWHGLTVDVPADWGWGTAPLGFAHHEETPYLCGGRGAQAGVGGVRPSEPKADTPWVGRPIMLSDMCEFDAETAPKAPYVWLGADVEPGTVEVGDGYTQVTVESFGTTLTVASPDPALRQHVLDSARATTDCEPQLPARPAVVGMPTEGLDPVHSAELCAYQKGDDGYDLVYAAGLDAAAARSLYGGFGLGSQSSQAFCADGGDEYVRVRFSGKDAMGTAELTADWVIDPVCQQVELGPGAVVSLKPIRQLWSRNGLQVVLHSSIGGLG